MKDIQLTEDNDLKIVDGDFSIGESEMQEVALILAANQGEWKEDPILGPNLIQLLKINESKADITHRVRIHLERDGKDYNEIENKIKLITNG
jgi:hypothetical protein